MKVLALTRKPGEPLTNPPSLEVIVDSATVPVSRPLFLPDFDSDWCVKFYPAFKISRLGKDISAKFASRYFDSFTVALRLYPLGSEASLSENNQAKGVLGIYDYCLAFGEWQPWSDISGDISVSIDGNDINLSAGMIEIDRVIESVSHYTTLKTGDVILPCELPVCVSAIASSDVKVKINSESEFEFRIR